MEIELTSDLLERLSRLGGLSQIKSIVEKAREGNQQAIRELRNSTVQLSWSRTWRSWPGPESVDQVNDAIRRELKVLGSHNTCKPSQSRRASCRSSGPQHILNVLSKIKVPITQSNTSVHGNLNADAHYRPSNAIVDPDHPSWRELARAAAFPLQRLTKSDCEILTLLERALIRGHGWGPSDRYKGQHQELPLIPSQLSRHGQKYSIRTYQRTIKHLVAIGLLLQVGVRLDGIRIYTVSWWRGVTTESPEGAWRTAATKQRELDSQMSDQSRTDVGPMSDQCRTSVAPPVALENTETPYDSNELSHTEVRQTAGRITSDIYVGHLDGAEGAPPPHSDRTAPCLPDGSRGTVASFKEE